MSICDHLPDKGLTRVGRYLNFLNQEMAFQSSILFEYHTSDPYPFTTKILI